MKFRTEIDIEPLAQKIQINDSIFSIGSCFATEMHQLLSDGQMQCLNNPFGTIFNPLSIKNELETLEKNKPYTEEDLISYQDNFISLDHHSSFNSNNLAFTLDKINQSIHLGNSFLRQSRVVIITYGTSYIYEFLPKQKLVANCHKIPGKFFTKKMLSPDEISLAIKESIKIIKSICKFDVQILFSISPVRHAKDGWIENNLSKAHLISAVHQAIKDEKNCHYLPIYELMLDDLRDYRFYKSDMLHPNQQAVQYIFDKFTKAYFSDEANDFLMENFKINQSLQHISKDVTHPNYLAFKKHLNQKIASQQMKVNHKIFVESKAERS